MVSKLLYRSRQRGFLELDLLVGLWAEQQVPHMDKRMLQQFTVVLDQVGQHSHTRSCADILKLPCILGLCDEMTAAELRMLQGSRPARGAFRSVLCASC
jgi:hypothetical protein